MLAIPIHSLIELIIKHNLTNIFPSNEDVSYYAIDETNGKFYVLTNIHNGQYCNLDYTKIYTSITDIVNAGEDVYYVSDIVNATLKEMSYDLANRNNKGIAPVIKLTPVMPKHLVSKIQEVESWYYGGKKIIDSFSPQYPAFVAKVNEVSKSISNLGGKIWLSEYTEFPGFVTKGDILNGTLSTSPSLANIDNGFFVSLLETAIRIIIGNIKDSDCFETNCANVPYIVLDLFKHKTLMSMDSMPYAIFLGTEYECFVSDGVANINNTNEWLQNGEIIENTADKLCIKKKGVLHTYIKNKDYLEHVNLILINNLFRDICNLINGDLDILDGFIQEGMDVVTYPVYSKDVGNIIYIEPIYNNKSNSDVIRDKVVSVYLTENIEHYVLKKIGQSLEEVYSRICLQPTIVMTDSNIAKYKDWFVKLNNDVMFIKPMYQIQSLIKKEMVKEDNFEYSLNEWLMHKLS